jgi:hypothetical protein
VTRTFVDIVIEIESKNRILFYIGENVNKPQPIVGTRDEIFDKDKFAPNQRNAN